MRHFQNNSRRKRFSRENYEMQDDADDEFDIEDHSEDGDYYEE